MQETLTKKVDIIKDGKFKINLSKQFQFRNLIVQK